MYVTRKLTLIAAALAGLFSQATQAATLEVGGGFGSKTLRAGVGSQEDSGVMVDDTSIVPVYSVRFDERYIGDSRWGYYVEFMNSYFEVDKQRIGGNLVDRDTSVLGFYGHLTPVLFYRFGDRYLTQSNNWNYTVGFGIGLGYLRMRGTMEMTELNPSEVRDLDIEGFGLSSGIVLEAAKGRWFGRLSNFSPTIEAGDTSYTLDDTSLTIGYRFDL